MSQIKRNIIDEDLALAHAKTAFTSAVNSEIEKLEAEARVGVKIVEDIYDSTIVDDEIIAKKNAALKAIDDADVAVEMAKISYRSAIAAASAVRSKYQSVITDANVATDKNSFAKIVIEKTNTEVKNIRSKFIETTITRAIARANVRKTYIEYISAAAIDKDAKAKLVLAKETYESTKSDHAHQEYIAAQKAVEKTAYDRSIAANRDDAARKILREFSIKYFAIDTIAEKAAIKAYNEYIFSNNYASKVTVDFVMPVIRKAYVDKETEKS